MEAQQRGEQPYTHDVIVLNVAYAYMDNIIETIAGEARNFGVSLPLCRQPVSKQFLRRLPFDHSDKG